MKRTASAHWESSGKEGHGTLSSQSTVLNNTQYSFNSRFAEGVGTNPEELVGAAHAGCFSMKLSFVIGEAGFTPESIDTKCTITFENGTIVNSHLELQAKVPGMTEEQFQEAAKNAKENCPISKLLNTEITLSAQLIA